MTMTPERAREYLAQDALLTTINRDLLIAYLASVEENERLREALGAAGEMREAADKVSEWFCVEASHLEGPRIQALRATFTSYDKHMEPKP